MRIDWTLARYGVLAFGLMSSTAAMAGPGSVNFQIAFTGHVDCYRPIAMNGIPISGSGTGTLNTDGSASADLTETAFILSTQIHFEGRLGRATPAPGGTRTNAHAAATPLFIRHSPAEPIWKIEFGANCQFRQG